MLFLHFFNLVMYGSLLMVLVVIGIKAYKDLQKEIAEKESPSEEGLSG
ncbi:hypothetical protein SAMN05216272_101780 [Pseudomonas panipatensis]|uniref:Uncharacterized protein n=2 Tax=Pseudomonas panipatensis TaxID=428992 RepID=A0A1G8CUR6_9PSED|nr:hypothetical protein SAMN05216272_101780 [Pseudomonas panipatensis]SMP63424.1 hypothetical protein SAMN06295951_10662 [Pseudomonas panipatensis]